jgi:hypothetical protein
MMKIKSKVVVFCDEGQNDWDNYFKREFDHAEIEFENLQVFDSPDAFEQSFEILMYDWGGMSFGNSMLDHFTRRIYELAEENPSKDFILLSRFTERAYEDMLAGGHEKLFNIYTAEQWIKLMDHT